MRFNAIQILLLYTLIHSYTAFLSRAEATPRSSFLVVRIWHCH